MTADVTQAEAAPADLPEPEDRQFAVTGELNAPEVPEAPDQDLTAAPDSGPASRDQSDQSDQSDLRVTVSADTRQAEAAPADLPEPEDGPEPKVQKTEDKPSSMLKTPDKPYQPVGASPQVNSAIVNQTELITRQALQKSQRDQARDLKWQMMEKAGRGKEAAEQRALWDAEQRKGGKLTDSERDMTLKLHELSWNMQNMRGQQFGDLSIKTNSLTARGGFQGAAVVPDSDRYNREIAQTNKTMLNVVQRIESLCSQLGKF